MAKNQWRGSLREGWFGGCRKQEGMQVTTDVRKALGEKAKLEREKALVKEEAARKALLEASGPFTLNVPSTLPC